MSLVSFGQPDDSIIQMAYVVTDIQAAMELWISKLKVGPSVPPPQLHGCRPTIPRPAIAGRRLAGNELRGPHERRTHPAEQ